MVVIYEAEKGKPTLDVSFAGYMGASQLNWKSDTYEVVPASVAGLSICLQNEYKGEIVLPIGSVEFVRKAAELTGVELPAPLNIPTSLQSLVERNVWSCRRSELKDFPCFVKPLDEVKLFTGFVAKSRKDFELYPELNDWDGMLWCSEPMGVILSEWRCYVREGKVFNCSCYAGDPLCFPDRMTIEEGLIKRYHDAPAGYALDVAVTHMGTELIECNDAWALGYYGGDCEDYFKMVKARWLEILKGK